MLMNPGNWEVISCYTRADAISDGILVDVSETAREAGFRFPCCITQQVHALCTPNKRESSYGQSYDGRLWDVIWMASMAARRPGRGHGSRTSYQVAMYEEQGSEFAHTEYTLILDIGPGDDPTPVLTIGFPDDF